MAIKKGDYSESVVQCGNILWVDPDNAKALYRIGQTRGLQKDYELALKDLKKALELEPNDKAIIAEINRVRKEWREYIKVEKEMCGKMFHREEASNATKNE